MGNVSPRRVNYCYFITFRTYGTWLHGDSRGSYSRRRKTYIAPDERFNGMMRENLVNPEVVFTPEERARLFDAIIDFGFCGRYNVFIDAVNVRSNHIHVLVTPRDDITPERLVNILKNYLTDLVKSFPRFRDYRRIWTNRFAVKIVYAAKTWHAVAIYTLLRQKGGNAYVRLTRFAERRRIPFGDDGEPNPDAFLAAFVNARIVFFRKNQLVGDEKNDVDIEIGEA